MVAESEHETARLAVDCPVLVTERLVLRPPHEDDVAEMADMANNRRVAEMLARMPHPYGEAEARRFIAQAREPRRSGIVYALTVAESGAFIGCAGLDGGAESLELGYWIGEEHWRNGYATEAAHALVDLAFRATAVEVLRSSCRAINPASRRVLHKSGFQYEGQGMMASLAAGRVPTERYRLDRRTWIGLRSWARL